MINCIMYNCRINAEFINKQQLRGGEEEKMNNTDLICMWIAELLPLLALIASGVSVFLTVYYNKKRQLLWL